MTDATSQAHLPAQMAVMRVFTAIVWVDGDLHDAEVSALTTLMKLLGIPQEAASAVWKDFTENVDTFDELIDWVQDDVAVLCGVPDEVKALLLSSAIMFMKSDGVNHPNEKKLIENMAKVWKVSLPEGTLD